MTLPTSDPSGLPPVQPAAAATDPEVLRLRGEVEKANRDLQALKNRVTAPPAPAATPQQGMSAAEMAREFYKDPVGHTAAIARQAAMEVNQQQSGPQQASLVQLTRSAAREKDSKFFDKYQIEIDAAVDSVAPQFRTNPAVWDNAMQMVKGRHVDEIIAERAAEAERQRAAEGGAPTVRISPGTGPAGPSARPAAAASVTELSQDEKRVARKLGLTEDQYKAGKAHLEGQNDPVRSPVGPSSWDKQITFDSKVRRKQMREDAARRKAS